MRRGVVGAVAAALVLAGCGDPATPTGVGGSAGSPSAVSVMSGGPVATRYPVTVIDDGDGAVVCLGGVAESLPPQCGGPRAIGWDWADHEGAYEEAAGVRFGVFAVTGTFDGTELTVTDALPADEWIEESSGARDVEFGSPCMEPAEGWPSDLVPMGTENGVLEAAQRRPDYAGGWVTQRDPRDPMELDQALADDPDTGVVPPIVNVRVTGDPADAEAELRQLWDGPLCVTTAERTESELRAIQDEVSTRDGVLGSSADVVTGAVDVTVTYDDGSLQSELDDRYGAGVVRVTSALVPAG